MSGPTSAKTRWIPAEGAIDSTHALEFDCQMIHIRTLKLGMGNILTSVFKRLDSQQMSSLS
ncbi:MULTISPECIES: hypothetical protein [unclassified Microcoleus]|uniref:hypothetical protein n=1 Tax=unclassified Microcoleus TaxID=2642155 RepID=UPI002FCF1741